MIDIAILPAFMLAALALNMTPGADMMFCLGQGLRAGARPAIAASAGISAGSLVHATITGLGLGAVVAHVPWVFDLIRWIGVAYLLFLAWSALKNPITGAKHQPVTSSRAFRDGFIVNVTNPKVILFVLAFVPQFVNPEAGSILGQFLIFGGILAVGGFFINGAVGVFAGGIGRRLTGSRRLTRALSYVTAAIFTGLALRLALMQRA